MKSGGGRVVWCGVVCVATAGAEEWREGRVGWNEWYVVDSVAVGVARRFWGRLWYAGVGALVGAACRRKD